MSNFLPNKFIRYCGSSSLGCLECQKPCVSFDLIFWHIIIGTNMPRKWNSMKIGRGIRGLDPMAQCLSQARSACLVVGASKINAWIQPMGLKARLRQDPLRSTAKRGAGPVHGPINIAKIRPNVGCIQTAFDPYNPSASYTGWLCNPHNPFKWVRLGSTLYLNQFKLLGA